MLSSSQSCYLCHSLYIPLITSVADSTKLKSMQKLLPLQICRFRKLPNTIQVTTLNLLFFLNWSSSTNSLISIIMSLLVLEDQERYIWSRIKRLKKEKFSNAFLRRMIGHIDSKTLLWRDSTIKLNGQKTVRCRIACQTQQNFIQSPYSRINSLLLWGNYSLMGKNWLWSFTKFWRNWIDFTEAVFAIMIWN